MDKIFDTSKRKLFFEIPLIVKKYEAELPVGKVI